MEDPSSLRFPQDDGYDLKYMASQKPKVNYDKEAKTLSIRLSHEKSVDSDVYGNIVVDYGKEGQLVNIDIMEISLNEFRRVPSARRMIESF